MRRLKAFAKASLVLALVALVLTAQGVAYSSPQSLNGVASWLSMRKVEVRCQTAEESKNDSVIAWGASGYVEGWIGPYGYWKPANFTVLKHGICEILLDIGAGKHTDHSVGDVTWALIVITHESGHLRGHRWSADEAKTQCWAMRHLRYVAHRFGIVDPLHQSLIVATALEIHKRMPAEYRLASCKLPRP